jgi:hypothetical protein
MSSSRLLTSWQHSKPAVVVDDYLLDGLKLLRHGTNLPLQHLQLLFPMLIMNEVYVVPVFWNHLHSNLVSTQVVCKCMIWSPEVNGGLCLLY